MNLLDTNFVLRYLIGDDERMATEAMEIVTKERCRIPSEVLAEAVYVLTGYYGLERRIAAEALRELLELESIVMEEKAAYREALRLFGEGGLDFVDCCLCAREGDYRVRTFDKRLGRCLEARRSGNGGGR